MFDYSEVLKSTYRDLKNFLIRPVARGYVTKCYIERNRTGINALAPFYSLCADLDDGTGRELIVCRKILRSQTAHYVFSLKSDDLWRGREQRSRLFIGKLRMQSTGEYVLYDNGAHAPPDEREDLGEAEEDRTDSTAQAKSEAAGGSAGAKGTDESSLYRKVRTATLIPHKSLMI